MSDWLDVASVTDEDNEYDIEYSKGRGMYRVSMFKDNHFQDEVIFDEIERGPCDFCSKVYTEEEYEQLDWGNFFIKDANGNICLLYSCDDHYYDNKIFNVKYCPCCGRRLK